jgi:hypothetical protein
MSPSHPASEQITLVFSATAGIIAVVTGHRYRHTEQILHTAGFNQHSNGTATLTTRQPEAMRAALTTLNRLAEQHNVPVTASTHVWIGDTAQQIAALLPGNWTVRVEVFSVPVWQEDLAESLWDNGDLVSAVRSQRIPYGAVLSDGDGTELLLVDQPNTEGQLLVGALAREGLYGAFADATDAPRSITTAASPGIAAQAITGRLLPAYREAVHNRRVRQVDQAHAQAYAEYETWDAIRTSRRYSDGTPLTHDDLPVMREQFLNQVWEQFRVFLDHGGHLLDYVDPPEGTRPPHISDSMLPALRALRSAHTTGSQILAAWRQTTTTMRDNPTALPFEPYPDALARRNRAAWPAVRIWLQHGRVLTAQARRDPWDREHSQQPVLPPTRPALPPGPGTGPAEGPGR